MKKIFLLLFFFSFFAGAAEYLKKEGVDSAGRHYFYVTNDPFHEREYTLKNGMKVSLSRVKVKPQIAYRMAVRAGGADSPAEASGLAHYLEHLMFKGTSRIGTLDYAKEKVLLDQIEQLFEDRRMTKDPKAKAKIYKKIDQLSGEAAKLAVAGEYQELIHSIGGMKVNAATGLDMTMFQANIPSNELEKLLKIESERFADPVIRLFHTELETVYEEFNMGQDNDDRLLLRQMFTTLFPEHPYGTIPLIGTAEHLKNPSIRHIRSFIRKYYVPGNMALVLVGDLEYEEAMNLVEKYFNRLPAGPKPEHPRRTCKLLSENRHCKIRTPRPERLQIVFPCKSGPREELLGDLLAAILSNGKAGLFERDLLRPQKLVSASASFYAFRDGSMLLLNATPNPDQSLDEAAKLLMAEVEKVRQGKFEEWLLPAILANYRKYVIQTRQDPDAITGYYLDSFIREYPYEETVRLLEDLKTITRKEVVAFARSLQYHVRIDKESGKQTGMVRIDKPEITPVELNAGKNSAYAKEFYSQPLSPLPEPDFLDFKKDVTLNGDLLYSRKPAPVNDVLYELNVIAPYGKNMNILLPLALAYAEYLGTDLLSASALRNEFYKTATDFSFSCSEKRAVLHLSGFQEDLRDSMKLVRHFLLHMKPDQKVYDKMVDRILKVRQDAKKNPKTIFRALNYYAAYGKSNQGNPFLYENSLTEKQLRSIKPADLVTLIRNVFGNQVLFAYAGPASLKQVQYELNLFKGFSDPMFKVPQRKRFVARPVRTSHVYLVQAKTAQLLVGFRTRQEVFQVGNMAKAELLSKYFNSIVYNEIREARGLVYTTGAAYTSACDTEKYDISGAFLATQPDKLFEAADAMLQQFRFLPHREPLFEQTRMQLLKQLSSGRRFGELSSVYFQVQDMGLGSDWLPGLRKDLQSLPFEDLNTFFQKSFTNRPYDLFIAGDVEHLDRKKLARYGTVVELTLEDIFGY